MPLAPGTQLGPARPTQVVTINPTRCEYSVHHITFRAFVVFSQQSVTGGRENRAIEGIGRGSLPGPSSCYLGRSSYRGTWTLQILPELSARVSHSLSCEISISVNDVGARPIEKGSAWEWKTAKESSIGRLLVGSSLWAQTQRCPSLSDKK